MQANEHEIAGYHAHVYFDATRLDAARTLCETARDRFDLKMGRMHERPVGPHPSWSCQLMVPTEKFESVVPWLARHRGDLTVFVHMLTGDDWFDHTQGVIWLGESEALDTSLFRRD